MQQDNSWCASSCREGLAQQSPLNLLGPLQRQAYSKGQEPPQAHLVVNLEAELGLQGGLALGLACQVIRGEGRRRVLIRLWVPLLQIYFQTNITTDFSSLLAPTPLSFLAKNLRERIPHSSLNPHVHLTRTVMHMPAGFLRMRVYSSTLLVRQACLSTTWWCALCKLHTTKALTAVHMVQRPPRP